MMDDVKPPPPEELGERGQALWGDLNRDLEFDDHELALLLETCRTVDVIESLAKAVRDDGVLSSGSTGQKVIHPAVPELRQQQAALSRLVMALNLSDALRGTVGAVGAARAISSQAQAAANARWRRSKRARGA